MCLLAIQFQTSLAAPLLLAANREEAYARPSSLPARHVMANGTVWLGGTDLRAGGTWLGANQYGVIVAVTNRPKRDLPRDPQSRGWLCRDLLRHRDVTSAHEAAWNALRHQLFAGCNLLVASAEAAVLIEAGDELRGHDLEPGLTLIANGPRDAPADPRLRRARQLFQDQAAVSAPEWVESAQRLFGLHGSGDEAPLCLHHELGGTVSATVLALTANPADALYRHAGGPPCTTPFEDYSSAFKQLLHVG